MKYRVTLVLIGFVICSSGALSQSILVTEKMFPQLQPILTAAVQQSPRMIERNLDLEIATGDAELARAGRLPYVSAYARSLLASDKREDIAGRLSTEKLYYDLAVTQSLLHMG
jgi:hypothetical protein